MQFCWSLSLKDLALDWREFVERDGRKKRRLDSDFSLRRRRLSYPDAFPIGERVEGCKAGTNRRWHRKGGGGREEGDPRGIIWWINTRKICHLKVINDCRGVASLGDASKIL